MSINVTRIYNMLIVDTDAYAGNFERQMCAYATGHTDDLDVANDLVDDDIQEMFEGYVDYHPDDNGYGKPCTIYPVDDGTYKAVALFFDEYVDLPKFELLEVVMSRCIEFATERDIKILGFKIIKIVPNITEIKLTSV